MKQSQKLKNTSIQFLKGVGPARKKLFSRLGVESIEDFLYFFPRRYEDRRHLSSIAQLQVGESQTVVGTVQEHGGRKSWFTKKHLTEVTIDDNSGKLILIWFNQPYLDKYFVPGRRVVCHGKVDIYKERLQMISPEYEILDSEEDEANAINRIVPIYPLTRGMTQRYLRKTMLACFDHYKKDLTDELPVDLRNSHRLANIKRSIHQIHFPETPEQQEEALRRISFEEFFFYQVSIMLRRLSVVAKDGVAHTIDAKVTAGFANGFPFPLTGAQKRVIEEIASDMRKPFPMLRLLQGDVGSGKTLVALFGCYAAFKNGYQSCIMAPTEILARQHFENIQNLAQTGPLKGMKAALLVSGLPVSEREKVLEAMKRGEIDLVVGTHALISEDVAFRNLSFAVVDEQHKFGVRQRAILSRKGLNPDILIMTATPIPRTLCITLYGDLDLSVIDEMPPGRGKIKTKLFSQEQAPDVYGLVHDQLKKGQQAYVVYPIIEESEDSDVKAAQAMAKQFQKSEFKEFKVGLIHGQMKKDQSEKIMADFKRKKIDLLVATTVVEVGVDVPNANVMVIEHAERFGLSSLHQLRGRIGRGREDGLCFLIADPQNDDGAERLKAVVDTTDGFKIAQKDLEIRGPGQFFGRHQHGLNELKVANPATQLDILELARQEAAKILKEDPKLEMDKHPSIRDIVRERYPTYLQMVEAG